MKISNTPLIMAKAARSVIFLCLISLLFGVTTILDAQQPQLSLADLLIGLRSKKATLEERNSILAEAVKDRGITFVLSPEIEKELVDTGASSVLIEAMRSQTKPEITPEPTPEPLATPTPAPRDTEFFRSRGDSNLLRGEFRLALTDYDKALELNPNNAVAFLNRGRAHYSLNSFVEAATDFDTAIELEPEDSNAFTNRGVLHERLGNMDKAFADYSRAVELDDKNTRAQDALNALNEKQTAKKAEESKAAPQPKQVEQPMPVKRPDSIVVGTLSANNAIKLEKPIYSAIAFRARIEGRVVVDLEIDEEGNVTSAKAASGPQMLRQAAEDAARKSKFKPAIYESAPIKAIGSVIYNFSLKP